MIKVISKIMHQLQSNEYEYNALEKVLNKNVTVKAMNIIIMQSFLLTTMMSAFSNS